MWQPIAEKQAERELIEIYAYKINAKVIKLQEDFDDGGVDGIIEINGEERRVEARRKGFPSHKGKVRTFPEGWKTGFLSSGVMINEKTIRNHQDKGFDFVVEIKGCKPRVASISPLQIKELLKQPYRTQPSFNSGTPQSIKTVPLKWFVEY